MIMEARTGGWKPNVYVLLRFLEKLWRQNDYVIRTRLQTAVGLNFDVFVKYLEWLRGRGFVETETRGDHEYIKISRSGYDAFRSILSLIEDILRIQVKRL